MNYKIDNLQYCNWSREIFEFNRIAGLDAVHVTIVYHEDYDELLLEIKKWENLFLENSDLIFKGKDFKDIEKANLEKKTAIFFATLIRFNYVSVLCGVIIISYCIFLANLFQ